MYFRVQETHLDTGPQYREKMSSELLQQKTSSVRYYISTEQAVTFVREKTFSTISRCKDSREESSKDLARQKMFLPLASLGSWQDSN